MVKYTFFRWALVISGKTPLTLLQWLGYMAGTLIWISGTRMSKVACENIDLCFPHLSKSERRKLARRSLQETGKTMLETSRYWTQANKTCLGDIKLIEDEELLAQLNHPRDLKKTNKSRSIIIIAPHLGNWELMNHYLGRHWPITHMYQPARSKRLNQLIQSCRKKTGTEFVPADMTGIKAQVKALAHGKNIGTMPDQEPEPHTGIFVDFFGIPALTSQLVGALCLKTDCIPVIASCCRLRSEKGFKVSLKPIDISQDWSLQDTMKYVNESIEAVIREYPEQYLWSYKRFRTRPAGEEEFYNLQDSRLKQLSQGFAVKSFSGITRYLPLKITRLMGTCWGYLAYWFNFRRSRITRKNLDICLSELSDKQKNMLRLESLQELGKTAAEYGFICSSGEKLFSAAIPDISGLEHLPSVVTNDNTQFDMGQDASSGVENTTQGIVVLTPPQGNREVVMRYLGKHYPTFEYYHPNGSTALDKFIRKSRYGMGVTLYPHTREASDILSDHLCKGAVVTLCPDQQPRLRGGLFVPFFNVPALTTLALADILLRGKAKLVYGIALRTPLGFQLVFSPIKISPHMSSLDILKTVNSELEQLIKTAPTQYRWSDKRFNIRPMGELKVYRS